MRRWLGKREAVMGAFAPCRRFVENLKNLREAGARYRRALSARKPDIKRMFIVMPVNGFGISPHHDLGENI
jgi:hypothetical protein